MLICWLYKYQVSETMLVEWSTAGFMIHKIEVQASLLQLLLLQLTHLTQVFQWRAAGVVRKDIDQIISQQEVN